MDYQQQIKLVIASICVLVFFAGLGLIYLFFTLRTRAASRRQTVPCPPEGVAPGSTPRPSDPRVTSPGTFISYAGRARQTPRDRLIQSLQEGLAIEQAATQLSIPVSEARLIWKAHSATAAEELQETQHPPPLQGATWLVDS